MDITTTGPGGTDPVLITAPAFLLLKIFLADNYPGRFRLKTQAPHKVGRQSNVEFRIDLVLEDMQTGRPICLITPNTRWKKIPLPKIFSRSSPLPKRWVAPKPF